MLIFVRFFKGNFSGMKFLKKFRFSFGWGPGPQWSLESMGPHKGHIGPKLHPCWSNMGAMLDPCWPHFGTPRASFSSFVGIICGLLVSLASLLCLPSLLSLFKVVLPFPLLCSSSAFSCCFCWTHSGRTGVDGRGAAFRSAEPRLRGERV